MNLCVLEKFDEVLLVFRHLEKEVQVLSVRSDLLNDLPAFRKFLTIITDFAQDCFNQLLLQDSSLLFIVLLPSARFLNNFS